MNVGLYLDIKCELKTLSKEDNVFGNKKGEANLDWVSAILNHEAFEEKSEPDSTSTIFREESPSLSSLHSLSDISIA